MANTLGGVNLARIAQLTLDTLQAVRFPIPAFFTDFSAEAVPNGNTVTTRVATQPSTQDFSSSKAATDVTTTAKTITLSNYKGVSIGFTDLERTYSDVNLIDAFIEPTVTAIFEDVMAACFALCTEANFGTANQATVTAANFDADDIADIASILSTDKSPMTGRSIILKPSYFAYLSKDNSIQAAYAYGGSEVIRENRAPRIHGFDVYEYTGTIPNNSEALEGIALHKSAIIIAARAVLPPPPGTWYGRQQTVVEPSTGLPIDIREFYDGTKLTYQWALNYGVAVGNGGATGALSLIASA